MESRPSSREVLDEIFFSLLERALPASESCCCCAHAAENYPITSGKNSAQTHSQNGARNDCQCAATLGGLLASPSKVSIFCPLCGKPATTSVCLQTHARYRWGWQVASNNHHHQRRRQPRSFARSFIGSFARSLGSPLMMATAAAPLKTNRLNTIRRAGCR